MARRKPPRTLPLYTPAKARRPRQYPARPIDVEPPRVRRGRPLAMGDIIGERPNGTLITAGERIVELLRVGMYLEPAAAAAKVRHETVYGWMREGAVAYNKAHSDRALGRQVVLSENDQDRIDFLHAVAEAAGEWEAAANTQLEMLGRGGHKTVTVTEKVNAKGELIERTTRTEALPPNAAVLQWRLARRFPERYTTRIEVGDGATDPTQPSMDDEAAALIASVEEFIAGRGTE